jgi:hypothetical protein
MDRFSWITLETIFVTSEEGPYWFWAKSVHWFKSYGKNNKNSSNFICYNITTISWELLDRFFSESIGIFFSRYWYMVSYVIHENLSIGPQVIMVTNFRWIFHCIYHNFRTNEPISLKINRDLQQILFSYDLLGKIKY